MGYKVDWQPMETVPEGERVLLLLPYGEKGNGEIAVGMVFPDDQGVIDCYWTWGGPNSGSGIDERPVRWAQIPDFPDDFMEIHRASPDTRAR